MANEEQGQQALYNGTETNLDEIDKEYKKMQEDAEKESRFRQIHPGKTALLEFVMPPKVYKRTSTGTDDKGVAYSSPKLDFELTDIVPSGKDAGKNKLFSMGAKNSAARQIIAHLKAGHNRMFVSRKGEGKNTKYEVTIPE
jgi:hypothetical protein